MRDHDNYKPDPSKAEWGNLDIFQMRELKVYGTILRGNSLPISR